MPKCTAHVIEIRYHQHKPQHDKCPWMGKLRVLCLHGSRQCSEIFESRLQSLARRLEDIAVLHFVDAPHELPLQPGQNAQDVLMRTWWRHPGIQSDVQQQQGIKAAGSHTDWGMRMSDDWAVSLQHLHQVWVSQGGFDIILGFSNGAAAAFLLASVIMHARAHAASSAAAGSVGDPSSGTLQWPGSGRRLRAVVLASGYVPQPLELFVPEGMQVAAAQGLDDATAEALSSVGLDPSTQQQLATPLPLASLHILSPSDKIVAVEQTRQLSRQFDASRRQVLEHELGHCVPQKAHHVEAVLDFLSWFEPPPDEPAQPAAQAGATPAAMSAPPTAGAAVTGLAATSMPGAGGGGAGLEPEPWNQALQGGASLAVDGLRGVGVAEEQVEEAEALQAIFDDSFTIIAARPHLTLKLSLAQPGTSPEDEGPPSRLFTLLVTLPEGYPGNGQPPVLLLKGPSQPLPGGAQQVAELMGHLREVAVQTMEETAMGCVYQVAEAAREWLDAQLPPDFNQTREEREAIEEEAAAAEAAGPPWWEKEEADGALIRAALTQASAVHWGGLTAASGYGDSSAVGQGAAEPVESSGGGGVEDGDSLQRGRWDYVIGLVGKPSAGKSSFFNAVTHPVGEDQGARVAAHPFTTIDPNIERGFVAVPDPAPALGLETSSCRPLHGYAHAFGPHRADPALNNLAPLRRWVGSLPWAQRNNLSAGSAPSAAGHHTTSTTSSSNSQPSAADHSASTCGVDAAGGSGGGGGGFPQIAWRRVRVLVKDVAGLVPGAYAGRGRGNAFLNDLCDADVLVHVVDASGCTDREGQAVQEGEGADPVDDVGWVREELHRWIYDNLRAKWATVRRKPSRLAELFSGYHAPRALVYEVLDKVGLPPSVLSSDSAAPLLAAWGEADLHRLVATFLCVRFPVLLALNKADLPSSEANIRRVRSLLPPEPAVALSAAAEQWLGSQRDAGRILYEDGAGSASVAPGAQDPSGQISQRLSEISTKVLGKYGSTGALLAITTAMAMRPPRVAFPVSDVTSCTAHALKGFASGVGTLHGAEDAKARAQEGSSPSVLRDEVLLKPGSTPKDLYDVLRKPPYQLLEGEYVRCEARVISAAGAGGGGGGEAHQGVTKAVLKKDAPLSWENCVLRIMTTRKNSHAK